jgi:hypothetical protein
LFVGRTQQNRDTVWQQHYKLLLEYIKREGHCRVPSRHEESGFRLGRWVHAQRQNRDKLDEKRRRALEKLEDWNWKGRDAKWNRAYNLLLEFVGRHGHAMVPKLYVEGGFALGVWVMHQRGYYRNGQLAEEREKKLEKVPGWSWFPRKDAQAEFPRSSSDPLPPHLANASLDQLAEEIWTLLFGLGTVNLPVAMDLSSRALYEKGLIRSRASSLGTRTGDLLYAAINTAVDYGFLDTPRQGYYRAVLTNPEDYEPKDWRMCLFNSIEDETIGRDEAVKRAARWARKNVGLQYTDLDQKSIVWKELDKAIDRSIKDKEIKQTVFYGVVKIHLTG